MGKGIHLASSAKIGQSIEIISRLDKRSPANRYLVARIRPCSWMRARFRNSDGRATFIFDRYDGSSRNEFEKDRLLQGTRHFGEHKLYRGRISDPAIFQSLAGRASSGVVTAQLSSATGADDLQLSDGRGVFHLKIVYPKDSRTVFERSGDVFKGVFYFNGNITTHTSVSGQVYTDYGSARSAAGKQINIVREMNAEKPFPQDYSPTPGPVTLKILSDGRIQNLFTSETL